MANKPKPQTDRHTGVAVFTRIPPDIYSKLREMATSDRRSLGNLVAIIIEKYFEKPAEVAK